MVPKRYHTRPRLLGFWRYTAVNNALSFLLKTLDRYRFHRQRDDDCAVHGCHRKTSQQPLSGTPNCLGSIFLPPFNRGPHRFMAIRAQCF